MNRSIVVLLLLGGVTRPAPAQTLSPETIARIDSVFAPFDRTDRPGCAVAVSQNGNEVFARGYGMSNLEYGLAITPGSIFHVASISKQFAAFAVALLAEDGKLSLDDPVQKYITELPDYGTPITIRQLIHHTSGIRDQWELLEMAGWRYGHDLFTQDDVLEIVKRQRALNFTPGSEYLYSNAGYSLLAMIVERVSGKSLRKFSEERMFGPLGMTSTHVHDDHQMIVANRTSAYEPGPGGGWRISIPTFDTHGATSLFSTASDLLKWEHNFVTGKVGSRALLDEAERSGRLTSGKEIDYGFGISIENYRGTPARGHGGADAGYRGDVVRFPEHGLAVAALCNFGPAVPNRYARAVADVLLEGKLQPKSEAEAAAAGKPVPATARDLDEVKGVYRKAGGDLAWSFTTRDGKLVLENFEAPLDFLGDRRYTAFGLLIEFLGTPGVPATSVKASFGAQLFDSLGRAARFEPTANQLQAYVGDYYSEDLDVVYSVARSDSGLTIKRPKRPPATMKPLYQDAFFMEGSVVRFVVSRGKVIGFQVSGGRVRNVAFAKGDPRRPK